MPDQPLLGRGSSVVVLSPHLDDAVLSCGALIACCCRAGVDVLVVTVFNGRPVGPLSRSASHFHARCGHTGRDAMAAREAEDDRALSRLGARTDRLFQKEALYRRTTRGAPAYPADDSVFVGSAPAAEVDAVLGPIVHSIDAARPDLVLAPLGIGGHVDHLVVADAARRLGRPVLHYEDVPYVLYDRCRGWETTISGRPARVQACSPQDWEMKVEAIACYASQREVLWYSPHTWESDLEAYAVAAGAGQPAERLWSLDAS